eukprot:1191562-Prorocentrum_minimum.AAC.1
MDPIPPSWPSRLLRPPMLPRAAACACAAACAACAAAAASLPLSTFAHEPDVSWPPTGLVGPMEVMMADKDELGMGMGGSG